MVDSNRRQAALALHRSGQAALAEAAYRALLADDPEDAETGNLLGVLLGQQDRAAEALDLQLGAVRANPRSAKYQANLGTTLVALGRYDEALGAFSAACELEPDSFDLHVDRGTTLAVLGRHVEAKESFLTALRLEPACFAAWNGLGQSAQALGETGNALNCFGKAAELEPRSALAHANRGAALSELGDHAAAAKSYRLAADCDPRSAEVRVNMAAALLASGATNEAEQVLRAALALDPNGPDAHLCLAEVHYARGDHERSAGSLERALDLDGDNLTALCNLARIRVEMGEFAQAESLYRRALGFCPVHGPAWIGLIETRHFAVGDADLAAMARLLEDTLLNPVARVEIGFAFSKACDDAGDFAAAGSVLVETCALARAAIEYDVAVDERRMREIEAAVDAPLVARWKTAGSTSRRPIFIVGMPRSGTTLLEQMLSSHPRIHGAGELPILPAIVRSTLSAGYPGNLADLDPDRVRQAAQGYLRALDRIDPEAPHVVDKLSTNFEYVGVIAAMFPETVILHCKRDALDTCWSCFRQPFTGGQLWSYDRTEIARYYLAYRRLMDHWNRILPGRVHEIQYEALVQDPERPLRAALEALGIPWDAACLQFSANRRPVKTASASQVRRPLYATAVRRSRAYGDLLDPLVAGLAGAVDSTGPESSPEVS